MGSIQWVTKLWMKFDKPECAFFDLGTRCALGRSGCPGCGYYVRHVRGVSERAQYLQLVESTRRADRALWWSKFAVALAGLTLLLRVLDLWMGK